MDAYEKWMSLPPTDREHVGLVMYMIWDGNVVYPVMPTTTCKDMPLLLEH